jgi:hypothetical protein
MAAKKVARRKSRSAAPKRKPKRQSPAPIPEPSIGPEGRFVRDLVVRGEAARPTRSGKLPQDATHAIVEDGAHVTVKRARFKLY